jgi:hypothetical protein
MHTQFHSDEIHSFSLFINFFVYHHFCLHGTSFNEIFIRTFNEIEIHMKLPLGMT